MEVTFVANCLIRDLFPKIVPFLKEGKKHWEMYYYLEDIEERLVKGDMQLLVGVEESEVKIILITEIIVYPRSKWVRIVYLGGSNLRGCEYFFKRWVDWAKEYNVKGIEFAGRKGLPRRLKKVLTEDGNGFDELVFIRKRF